jgi:AcrR family transcriptional regulator
VAKRDAAPRLTKEKILEAALAVFGDRGYRGASIDEVAARAGVTKGAVYYWFKDKDDLARDLQRSIWERLKGEALAAFDPEGDTVRNLNRCFDAYLTALARAGDARFFLRESFLVPVPEEVREELESASTLVRALLEEGIRRGDIVALDPDAMAHVLVGVYNEATLHILQTGEARPTLEVIRRLVGALAAPGANASTRAKAGARAPEPPAARTASARTKAASVKAGARA